MKTTRGQAEDLATRIRTRFPSPDLQIVVREDLSRFGLPEYLIEVSRDGDGVLFSLDSLDGGPGAIRPEALAVIAALAGTRPNESLAGEENPQEHPVREDEAEQQAGGEVSAAPEDQPRKRRQRKGGSDDGDDQQTSDVADL